MIGPDGICLWAEFGIIDFGPGEIAVVPRGVKLHAGPAQGYLGENYGGAFTLLERGPKGAFEEASNADLRPHKLEGTMAFMFETRYPQRVTALAADSAQLQRGYGDYGAALVKRFDPARP